MKAPRWTIAFLRALERSGVARWAATDAGVDFTTAYARRKRHSDFAEAWAAALARGRAERERVRGAELAGRVARLRKRPSTIASSGNGPPPSAGIPRALSDPRSLEARSDRAKLREELTIVNGQLKRVGPGRWGAAKEQALLAELAWSGNIGRGCRAAGVSSQALSTRRLRDRHLDTACDAAIEIARTRLGGLMVELGNRTFDPDELPLGADGPKMTIAEAIQVLKFGAGRRPAPAEPQVEAYVVADVKERLEKKMRLLGLMAEEEDEARAL